MANKIKYGLKNVYYALITIAGALVSYGTPVRIPGAVNLTSKASGDKSVFYADDISYFVQNANNGYEGSLEMALVPDSFKKDVLGFIEDANGVLFEDADAIAKDFALLFEFAGDANAVRHLFYNVNAARPNVESSTKSEKIEVKTETLEITASPASDTGFVKAKAEPAQTVSYAGWYTAVYLYDGVINSVTPSTATFSKAAPADLTVDSTSSDATNAVKNVKLDGALIPGVSLTATGVDVTIASAYIAALDNGVYTVTVEFERGNAISVALTVTA